MEYRRGRITQEYRRSETSKVSRLTLDKPEADSRVGRAPSPAARPPYSCFVRKIEVLGISTVVAGGRCGKLRWLDSVLAPTHHLRYVREERATRCYDFDPQYAKRLDQSVEQRVAPCFQTNTQMSSGVATRLYYKAFAETRSCPRNQQ